MAPFPSVGLVAPQGTAGEVSFCLEIFNSDVGRTAIVAGEHHERVVRDAVFVESTEDSSDDGVRLHNEIGEGVESAFLFPLGVYCQRGVRRGEWHVEEERLFGLGGFSDEPFGACGEFR